MKKYIKNLFAFSQFCKAFYHSRQWLRNSCTPSLIANLRADRVESEAETCNVDGEVARVKKKKNSNKNERAGVNRCHHVAIIFYSFFFFLFSHRVQHTSPLRIRE